MRALVDLRTWLKRQGAAEATWWEVLRELYFSFDKRTLGLSRIAIGFLMLMDLAHRGSVWSRLYSDEGVLPAHVVLAHRQADNFSLFHAFTTRGEVTVLFAIGVVIAGCLLVGYKTKVAQILALVFVTSMNGRLLLVENGGYVVENLLFLWSAFLPLGERFSVDAFVASMRRRPEQSVAELSDRDFGIDPEEVEPHVTLIGPVLCIQIAAIYFFNVVHKTGPAWKNGTAVHYVLYVDRMVTPLVAALREHVPGRIEIFLTRGTLLTEAALAFLVLMPILRPWAKMALVAGMMILHTGFGTTFVLGPFAWSCCTMATLMIPGEAWDLAARAMRRERRAVTVLLRRGSRGALFVGRILKRLDGLELLSFAPNDGPDELAAVDGAGRVQTGARALRLVVAALPLGPLVAWMLSLPGAEFLARRAIATLHSPAFAELAPPSQGAFSRREAPTARAWRRLTFALGQLAAAVMFVAAIDQAFQELWVARPLHVPQPEAMRVLTLKLRFLQGWFMFSPNPVMDDGDLVVDAVTGDGRHVDPFTERAPNFDLLHAKSLRYSQTWCDYKNRIQLPGNAVYRDAMKDYILRLSERTGRAEDRIVSAEVWWVSDLNPRFGRTESTHYEKKKIYSFTAAEQRTVASSR